MCDFDVFEKDPINTFFIHKMKSYGYAGRYLQLTFVQSCEKPLEIILKKNDALTLANKLYMIAMSLNADSQE
jgi:hypothetical protein